MKMAISIKKWKFIFHKNSHTAHNTKKTVSFALKLQVKTEWIYLKIAHYERHEASDDSQM